MSPLADITPSARTWRDIPQQVAPRAMSGEGRKRMAFATVKTVGLIAIGAACLWAGYELFSTWQSDPVRLRAPIKNNLVRKIELRTDGVLDRAWAEQALALGKGADLMELDLTVLRARLLAHPQVRTAVIAKKFPDAISVVLEERVPVARINVLLAGDDAPATYLAARDGVIFVGVGFKDEVMDALPHIDGVKLKRVGRTFSPITGMDTVADLVVSARGYIPALFARWKVISLARFETDGVLLVKTADLPEIIFGTRDSFEKQIARLDLILDDLKTRPDHPPLRMVNLAVGGAQVPVAFMEPLPTTSAETNPTHSLAAPKRDATRTLRATPRRPTAFFKPLFPSPL